MNTRTTKRDNPGGGDEPDAPPRKRRRNKAAAGGAAPAPYDEYPESVFMKDEYIPSIPDAPPPISSAPPVTDPAATDITADYAILATSRRMLTESTPFTKRTKTCIAKCNDAIQHLIANAQYNNTDTYARILNVENDDELEYFKTNLSYTDQERIIQCANDASRYAYIDKPPRIQILETDMPVLYKAIVLRKIAMLEAMGADNNEYFKIKAWINAFIRIPFGKYRSLSISIADGPEICGEFMDSARKTLDACVYGLRDAKMQILQMLGQWVSNPASLGSAIAIHGPMGTGKTSIVKHGISKILGREFAFVSLGGASGGSFLDGHAYTYEGSTYGKIIQVLIDAGSMNPVIYFDELDKLSDCPRGNEIANLLIHITDPVQNAHFRDNYFAEISIDLSKCIFIFSYNDASKINPILRDRMYNIRTTGYSAADKRVIAQTYLLPRIREQVHFSNTDVIITDKAIDRITGTAEYTENEAGVRNLNRCLEVIHTKLNLVRLLHPRTAGFKGSDAITFPCTVTAEMADTLLKSETRDTSALNRLCSMYI